MFYTKYKPFKDEPEVNSGEVKVKPDGYIPIERQVNEFLNAGTMLSSMREIQYQYDENHDGEDAVVSPVATRFRKDKMDVIDIIRDQTERAQALTAAVRQRVARDDAVRQAAAVEKMKAEALAEAKKQLAGEAA